MNSLKSIFIYPNPDGRIYKLLKHIGRKLLFLKGLWEVIFYNILLLLHFKHLKNKCIPDFMCVGAQKSATTWLDKMLRYHPQICMPSRRKEIHFFDNNLWKGRNWYLSHFTKLKPNQICGEITPSYSVLPLNRVKQMKSHNPQLKIIIILRDPIERAWSQMKMDLIRNPGRSIEDIKEEDILRHIKSPGSINRGDYETIISKYTAVFGKNQVFTCFFDDIQSRPRHFLQSVFNFLEVSNNDSDYKSKGINTAQNRTRKLNVPSQIMNQLSNIYVPKLEKLYIMVPNKYIKGWIENAKTNS